MTTRYKFLNKSGRGIKSANGGLKWKIGEWQHVDGDMELCERGLHCSKKVYQAFSYIQGDVLAVVEVKGKSKKSDDKECWSDMRIVKAYKWQRKDSLELAIFSAELVLKYYEKKYPDDMRPRKAIEAAKKVLFKDTAKNRNAAYAAYAAANAAYAAAYAAYAAAYAAYAAADAAYAAANAANAANAAAYAAANAKKLLIRKIDRWMTDRMKELEEF